MGYHSLQPAFCQLLGTLESNSLCSSELSNMSCQPRRCCSQKKKGTCLLFFVNKPTVVHGAQPQLVWIVGNQRPQTPASPPLWTVKNGKLSSGARSKPTAVQWDREAVCHVDICPLSLGSVLFECRNHQVGWIVDSIFFILQEADIAVAPLTVTSAREEVVSFTTPFLQTGIGILLRKDTMSQEMSFFHFLAPFSKETWTGLLFAYILTCFCLFLVARYKHMSQVFLKSWLFSQLWGDLGFRESTSC